jgi:hypothetical protein
MKLFSPCRESEINSSRAWLGAGQRCCCFLPPETFPVTAYSLMSLAIVCFLAAGQRTFQLVFAEDEKTAWTFEGKQPTFKVTFPSSDWRTVSKPGEPPTVFNPKHPTMAGVDAFTENQDSFLKVQIPAMRKLLDDCKDNFHASPVFSEGKAGAGHPYMMWQVLSKTAKGVDVFLVFALVHCKERETTVKVVFEGRIHMKSMVGRAEERKFFERAASAIIHSVE